MNIEESVILVVDDKLANLNVLLDFFGETDFEILFDTDGGSALKTAANEQPDLILLDIVMPGIDGFEVCRRLKENEKTEAIPVVFMTALSDTVDKVKGFDLGAVDYITKPFECEEVLARIKTHLTLQSLKKESEVKNKKLSEALEREQELNQLKSRFVSMASHEIRGPLGMISLFGSILLSYSDKLSDEQKNTYLNQIQDAVKHGFEMLDEVLLLSKTEAGKIEFKPKQVNADLLCHKITEEFRMISAGTHTIHFDCKYDQILADEKLLRHILSNLLSNAIKYSPAGGAIYFEFKRENDNAVFRVKDEGIGIPEEDQKRLFEAFHRAGNVEGIEGTGLGLSIVKQFVDLHNGKIKVKSMIGEGSIFTVSIPLRNSEK